CPTATHFPTLAPFLIHVNDLGHVEPFPTAPRWHSLGFENSSPCCNQATGLHNRKQSRGFCHSGREKRGTLMGDRKSACKREQGWWRGVLKQLVDVIGSPQSTAVSTLSTRGSGSIQSVCLSPRCPLTSTRPGQRDAETSTALTYEGPPDPMRDFHEVKLTCGVLQMTGEPPGHVPMMNQMDRVSQVS
ncbi:hypothetical protein KUCAC02_011816, partial [Chaenocephalus aceratus]